MNEREAAGPESLLCTLRGFSEFISPAQSQGLFQLFCPHTHTHTFLDFGKNNPEPQIYVFQKQEKGNKCSPHIFNLL